MKKLTIQGKTCYFIDEHFTSSRFSTGGLLYEPVELEVGDYNLTFYTLDAFTDSGQVYGGFLTHPHLVNIANHSIPIVLAHFYYNSTALDYALLSENAVIKVGQTEYIFTDILYFHPNGMPLRGELANPSQTQVKVLGTEIFAHTIAFWETGIISGIIPLENTPIKVHEKIFEIKGANGEHSHCQYSLNFTQQGELDWGILSDGSQIDFHL